MTNEEYIRRYAAIYNVVLKMRRDDDYAINPPQMEKLVELYKFFIDLATGNDEVEELRLKPSEVHGGVTATFLVFDVYGAKVQEFCRVLSPCTAVTIDATDDGVCISCTVPNVFVRKQDLQQSLRF